MNEPINQSICTISYYITSPHYIHKCHIGQANSDRSS